MQQEKQGLLDFSKHWDEAMIGNDANKIAEFMSDDWKIISTDGITSRASFLEFISSGVLTHNRMDSDETDVSIYGNTGILVSRGTSAGTYRGENFSFYEWSTSFFIRTESNWLCVLTMITPANKSK